MAAGLGFKTFTTGEVLTAANVNGYLMQGVLVFASSAARDAAITSPQEGQFAYTKDTNGLWYYDGAAWVASGATGDIEGVTAGTGISGGGTSGTVTVTNSMATAITTNGDIIYGTGSGTFNRLGIGSTNQSLNVTGGIPAWSASPTSVLTTTGDMLYASAANTLQRRAIGSTDQVLTVSGGLPTWATPSSGSMTSIASGTMSGSTVTLSSISASYKNLQLVIRNVYGNVSDIFIRFNSNSGNNYFYNKCTIGTAAWSTQAKQAYWYFGDPGTTASNGSQIIVDIPDYASTTTKTITSQASFPNPGAGSLAANFMNLNFGENNPITSITIHTTINSFDGGTYILYGVN